jgi:hypothetical protein
MVVLGVVSVVTRYGVFGAAVEETVVAVAARARATSLADVAIRGMGGRYVTHPWDESPLHFAIRLHALELGTA